MVAKRIIPCLDVKNGRVVKGRSFVSLRDAGDPVDCGRAYSDAGADELVFLDITATLEARKTIRELVSRVAEQVFIPFTVGGGIRGLDDIRALLKAGADKVSINTAAVRDKQLIRQGAEAFGAQCIVVAVDAKRVGKSRESLAPSPGSRLPRPDAHPHPTLSLRGRGVRTPLPVREGVGGGSALGAVPGQQDWGPRSGWEVYVDAGHTPTGLDALAWVREAEELGAGEILLTSIDADGHTAGYDIELTAAVSDAVSIPVIASGGAGGPEDMLRVLTDGKADAALAASIFHYGQYTIAAVKDYLRQRGVHVRK